MLRAKSLAALASFVQIAERRMPNGFAFRTRSGLPFLQTVVCFGSMPFCVELDNLKDTDAPIHQPAAMLVAAD